MNNVRKLKGKNFRISADLPIEIVDRRKKALPKFFAAEKAGKSAYFSRAEPDKLFFLWQIIFCLDLLFRLYFSHPILN